MFRSITNLSIIIDAADTFPSRPNYLDENEKHLESLPYVLRGPLVTPLYHFNDTTIPPMSTIGT